MKRTTNAQHTPVGPATLMERRGTARVPASFGLMYSALDKGEVLMGDGIVIDLSKGGLGIRGNQAVREGLDMTLFLYLPDGEDPMFVLEASVAWTEGREFGVQFNRLSFPEGKRLQAFLLTQNRQ